MTFSFHSASLIIGNVVAMRTKSMKPRSPQLFRRNVSSRENSASISRPLRLEREPSRHPSEAELEPDEDERARPRGHQPDAEADRQRQTADRVERRAA